MNYTKDYDKFIFLEENRKINYGLVKRLIDSIKNIGFIESSFILIDQNWRILDGQHRFLALKELEQSIPYVQIQTQNQDNIIKELNKNQLIWRLQDFIGFYSKKGVFFHQEVERFNEKHKLNISNSIAICSKANSSQSKNIRNGIDIELNPHREDVANFVHYCKDLPFAKSKNFVNAVCVLYFKANPEQIKKLKKYYQSIKEQPRMNSYLTAFENIINRYVKSDDSRIYF